MMALSRRLFLKRLGGALAAFGIGAKLVEALPEPTVVVSQEAADALWVDQSVTTGNYTVGYLYCSHDYGKTWTLATHEDCDGVIGVAISPTVLCTQGIVSGYCAELSNLILDTTT